MNVPQDRASNIEHRMLKAPVDTGLHQLTSVDAGLPPHAIAQNEPTVRRAAHAGLHQLAPVTASWCRFRAEADLANRDHRADACNAMQPDATPCNATQPFSRFGKTNPPQRVIRTRAALGPPGASPRIPQTFTFSSLRGRVAHSGFAVCRSILHVISRVAIARPGGCLQAGGRAGRSDRTYRVRGVL